MIPLDYILSLLVHNMSLFICSICNNIRRLRIGGSKRIYLLIDGVQAIK